MASGDTKTEALLNILGNGGSYEGISGCGNTKTQDYIIDAIDRIQAVEDEVEELKNNPDVFDIVDTYADLQNYDTSTITDKDVIRVLQDENHGGASTYYRWNASTSSFDYIGEVGDYYTKAQTDNLLNAKADKATTYTKTEVDTALAGKQDTLLAGDHISFNGNTINAECDTTILYLDNYVAAGNTVKFYKDSSLTEEVRDSELIELLKSGKAITLLYDENGEGQYTNTYDVYYRAYDWGTPMMYVASTSGFYTIDLGDGPTYSGGYVREALPGNVQKRLTAGDNITIAQNGTISAAGLTTLSYGNSTWNDFIKAYNKGNIVYCRASSNSNPATGTQTRMAFMAYINNPTTPTEVEFQYVRSVSTKTAAQQMDQVFVYKLTSAGGGTWTVATRDMTSKIVAGTNMTSSYSNGTLTLNASGGGGSSDTATFYMSVTPFADNSGVSLYSDIALTTAVPASTFVQALRDCKSVFLVCKRGDYAWSERYIAQIVYSCVPNADTAEAYDEVFPAGYYFDGPTGNRYMIQSATSDPDDTASFTIYHWT